MFYVKTLGLDAGSNEPVWLTEDRVIQFYAQLMDDLFTDSQNRLRLFKKNNLDFCALSLFD